MRLFHQILGMQGDINRDLGFAKLDWNGARNGFIWDMVATSAKAFCAAIPDVTRLALSWRLLFCWTKTYQANMRKSQGSKFSNLYNPPSQKPLLDISQVALQKSSLKTFFLKAHDDPSQGHRISLRNWFWSETFQNLRRSREAAGGCTSLCRAIHGLWICAEAMGNGATRNSWSKKWNPQENGPKKSVHKKNT